MKYWKLNREISPIAIDYEIIDSGDTFKKNGPYYRFTWTELLRKK